MPVDLKRLGIFFRKDAEVRVFFERPGQGRSGRHWSWPPALASPVAGLWTWPHRGGRALRKFFVVTVWKLDMNAVRHSR